MSESPAMRIPPVSVLGIGAVTPTGRDLDVISRALEQPPATSEGPLRVTEELSDPAINAQMRRADRFAKMAAIAAIDAWNSAKSYPIVPGQRVALIFSSGFGPHGRGFRFLDGILDNGDDAASPTDFSHSVHGAASAYISRMLEIRGPSLNVTDFEIGFEEALRIAQVWLNDGMCDRVLIGAAEELGEVLIYCANGMLGTSTAVRPSEGAVFLLLGRSELPGIAEISAGANLPSADLLIVEDPRLPTSAAHPMTVQGARRATFTGHFGHSSSAAAFDTLGGLLAMRSDRPLGRAVHGGHDLTPSPSYSGERAGVRGESRDIAPPAPHPTLSPEYGGEGSGRIDSVATLRTSSDGHSRSILLTRRK